MKKRRWSQWLTNVPEKLNSVSGVAGVGGTAMAVAGGTLLTGAVATALTFGGVGLAAGAFGYAVWSAIPRAMRDANVLVGQTLDIAELADVYPPLDRLAIVGSTRSGKSTLKSRLQFETPSHQRTTSVTATIVSIPTNPVSYLAVLDGGGEKFPQQFKIAEHANLMCLILDHNISDSESQISYERQSDTTKFMTQIREHLIETGCEKKDWIGILANKRDLWERLGPANQTSFVDFVADETQKWQGGNYSHSVTMNRHSNENVNDIGRLINEIKSAMGN